MSIEEDKIPIIAEEDEVRDLVQGITHQEYGSEKVESSIKYGSAEVCLMTNKFDWKLGDKQWHRARVAANYFGAAHLLPKTIASQDTGMPLYLTYRKIATDICVKINEGLPGDTSDESGMVIVKSTRARNYYTNPKAEPFMVTDGFGGGSYENEFVWKRKHDSEV